MVRKNGSYKKGWIRTCFYHGLQAALLLLIYL